MVDGKPPKVEIIDERTIKYTWDKPNPYFIESQARAAPLFLFRPAHYLKKFHPSTAGPRRSPSRPRAAKAAAGCRSTGALDVMYNNDNLDLPTLNPWVNTTPSPAQRFVFERNPYYHRIDEKGQQLPYIDQRDLHPGGDQPRARQGGAGRGRPAAALPQHARLHLPAEERQELGRRRAPVGVGLGLAARALSQPQRQRRGMAQADARRALPPGLVARDRPRRAERGRLYRPGQALQQHDHGALGAVQARVRDQVGAVRSQARQQASRRDRPHQARPAGHPPAARRHGRPSSWSRAQARRPRIPTPCS